MSSALAADGSSPGIGSAFATGLLVDPAIRKATIDAVPPLSRLGLALARRVIRQRVRHRRRLLPGLAATGAVTAAAVVLSNPRRRGQLRRLIAH